MRYPTNSDRSSVDRVHVSETCEGPRTLPESVGGEGGVVSCGVVTVTELPELAPFRINKRFTALCAFCKP
jgi:hypothetical protein